MTSRWNSVECHGIQKIAIVSMVSMLFPCRVPTGSGKQGKNNGQGKVREFYFGPKVREKSGNFFILCQKSGYFFPKWLNAGISIKY